MVSCHRSETPLIYKAVPSWFVRVQHAQEKLLENNKKTYWWVPVLSDWSGKVSEVIDGFSVLFDGAFSIECFEQPGCYCLVGANAECELTTAACLHVITSHNMRSLLWSDMLLVKHFPEGQDQQVQGLFPANSCQTAQLLTVISIRLAIQDEALLCVCVWGGGRWMCAWLCVCVYRCVAMWACVWGGGERKEARARPCVRGEKTGQWTLNLMHLLQILFCFCFV